MARLRLLVSPPVAGSVVCSIVDCPPRVFKSSFFTFLASDGLPSGSSFAEPELGEG